MSQQVIQTQRSQGNKSSRPKICNLNQRLQISGKNSTLFTGEAEKCSRRLKEDDDGAIGGLRWSGDDKKSSFLAILVKLWT